MRALAGLSLLVLIVNTLLLILGVVCIDVSPHGESVKPADVMKRRRDNVPTFYMMVGLPASGKTTKAKWMEENCPCTEKVVAISSDALREKLLGDAGDQSRNSEIFDILHSLVKAHLYYGNSVVFDATNLGSRFRKQFLKSLELLPCKKVCIYKKTPYEVCLERNGNRERQVPFGVMQKMNRFLEEPAMDEGWDSVYVEEDW